MLAVEVNVKLRCRRTQSFETPKFSPLIEHAHRIEALHEYIREVAIWRYA